MASSCPFFSVVIPVFNRASSISPSIMSCIGQTFGDFEIIIIDDGSSDHLEKVVSEFKDDRIKYFYQENSGGAVARNLGVCKSKGKYIAFLDSDDLFMPNKLEIYRDRILRDHSDCTVYYSFIKVAREGKLCWRKPDRGILDGESVSSYLMIHHQFIQTSTIVLPRLMALKTPFTPGLIYGQDTDFSIKLEKSGAVFSFIAEELTEWLDLYSESRVSSAKRYEKVLEWLDSIKSDIGEKAYYCYKGFHVAKMAKETSYVRGVGMYLSAVFRFKMPLKLVVTAGLQVMLSRKLYRALSNLYIAVRKG